MCSVALQAYSNLHISSIRSILKTFLVFENKYFSMFVVSLQFLRRPLCIPN